jgi:hypothetical protein
MKTRNFIADPLLNRVDPGCDRQPASHNHTKVAIGHLAEKWTAFGVRSGDRTRAHLLQKEMLHFFVFAEYSRASAELVSDCQT